MGFFADIINLASILPSAASDFVQNPLGQLASTVERIGSGINLALGQSTWIPVQKGSQQEQDVYKYIETATPQQVQANVKTDLFGNLMVYHQTTPQDTTATRAHVLTSAIEGAALGAVASNPVTVGFLPKIVIGMTAGELGSGLLSSLRTGSASQIANDLVPLGLEPAIATAKSHTAEILAGLGLAGGAVAQLSPRVRKVEGQIVNSLLPPAATPPSSTKKVPLKVKKVKHIHRRRGTKRH